MSNHESNRVLNRRGALELTEEELEQVLGSAGHISTLFTRFNTAPITNPDIQTDE